MSRAIVNFIFDNRGAEVTLSEARRHQFAATLLIASGFTVAGMMASFKLLYETLSLPQAIFLRTLGGVLLTLPMFRLAGVRFLPEGRFGLYGLRIGFAIGGLTCWLYSIAHLPLAIATALSFSKSLFILWFGAALLGEALTSAKVVVTVVGFLGVLLILEPGVAGTAGDATLVAGAVGVLGALFGAALTVVVKQLASTEPTLRLMFYPLAGVSLTFAAPALANWTPLGARELWLVAGMTLYGAFSQWCFLTAYRLGDLTALAPVEYTRILAAVIVGFLVFSEFPTPLAWLGIVVVAAATYASMRIRQGERRSAPEELQP